MMYQNVGVYYDSDTVRYQFSLFENFKPLKDLASFNDEIAFANSEHKTKIAAVHVPFPFNGNNFVAKVERLRSICNHVFVIATEVHPEIVDFIQKNDHYNFTYYICGILNCPMQNAQVKQFMDWFETSSYFYRHWLPEILTRLKPFEEKYRTFDILLGRKKLHRDELYKHCQKKPNIGIITYFNDHNISLGNNPDQWIWEHPGVKIEKTPRWTVDNVLYYGHPMSLSQIIPINVYNQTAYSIVAETNFNDSFSFFTEKTSKPIIAKRLFVMFAGRHYLDNLRKLGFKTFDSIIDESYDDETDALIRWSKAWDQMLWLSNQSQFEIFEKIRPIVEHNFNHMMTTNWAKDFRSEFEKDFVHTIAD